MGSTLFQGRLRLALVFPANRPPFQAIAPQAAFDDGQALREHGSTHECTAAVGSIVHRDLEPAILEEDGQASSSVQISTWSRFFQEFLKSRPSNVEFCS